MTGADPGDLRVCPLGRGRCTVELSRAGWTGETVLRGDELCLPRLSGPRLTLFFQGQAGQASVGGLGPLRHGRPRQMPGGGHLCAILIRPRPAPVSLSLSGLHFPESPQYLGWAGCSQGGESGSLAQGQPCAGGQVLPAANLLCFLGAQDSEAPRGNLGVLIALGHTHTPCKLAL